jgi:hypothetical protein
MLAGAQLAGSRLRKSCFLDARAPLAGAQLAGSLGNVKLSVAGALPGSARGS